MEAEVEPTTMAAVATLAGESGAVAPVAAFGEAMDSAVDGVVVVVVQVRCQ